MGNETIDDIRVADADGSDPQSVLDATARAVRVRQVDAAGDDASGSVVVTSLPDVTVASVPAATGTASVTTSQVTTASAATSQVAVAARVGRSLVHLKNIDTTNTIYISETSPASLLNSYPLLAGEDAWYPTSAALYCRSGAGTPVLVAVEFY